MCVTGSDAYYVQLANCFSRLWSQFGDLLTLCIVCGWCQPNSRYNVKITLQLFSEEIQRPRNRELGWAILSCQMAPLPPSPQIHLLTPAWVDSGWICYNYSIKDEYLWSTRRATSPHIAIALHSRLPSDHSDLKFETQPLAYGLARDLNRPDAVQSALTSYCDRLCNTYTVNNNLIS